MAASVVIGICTRNRSGMLADALESIAALDVPPGLKWSVVVVDNGSTDDTPETLERFAARLPLRWVVESEPGIANARNRMLAEAAGDYLVFVDDDVRVTKGWLQAFCDAVAGHPEAAVIGGPIEPMFVSEPDAVMADVFSMLKSGFCGLDHGAVGRMLPEPLPLFTANMGLRLAAAHGLRFDTRLGHHGETQAVGEDLAMLAAVRSRGGLAWWCPAMRVRHVVPTTRTSLAYVSDYYRNFERSLVRMNGRPAGAAVAGLRIRALASWAKHTALYSVLRHTANRRRALISRRESVSRSGELAGSWELRHRARRRAAPASPAKRTVTT